MNKRMYLYKVSYEFTEFAVGCHGSKNIVANGSAASALKKALPAIQKMEPDARRLVITSVERLAEVDCL